MPAKLSQKEFLLKVFKKRGTTLTVLDEYKNLKTPILVRDNETGEFKKMLPDNILRGISKNPNQVKFDNRSFQEYIDNRYPDRGYVLKSDYKSNNSKNLLYCPKHECYFELTYTQMRRSGTLCPECKR